MNDNALRTVAAVLLCACCGCTTPAVRSVPAPPQEVRICLDNTVAYSQFPTAQGSPSSTPTRGPQAPQELLEEITAAYKKDTYGRVIGMTEELLSYPTATPYERAEALTYAGAIAFVHGDNEKARQYFLKALRENPDAIPDERIRTTSMMEFFQSVRHGLMGR